MQCLAQRTVLWLFMHLLWKEVSEWIMNCWWLMYIYRTIIGAVFLCVWLFLFIWVCQLTECDITTPIYRWRNRTRKNEKLAQVEKPTLLISPLISSTLLFFLYITICLEPHHWIWWPRSSWKVLRCLRSTFQPWFSRMVLLFFWCPCTACLLYIAFSPKHVACKYKRLHLLRPASYKWSFISYDPR